jgi:hypothetical protein
MAAVRYRCQSCGGIHEISRRFDGTTYLRCAVTGEWAWHDPSALLPPEGAEAETARSRRGDEGASSSTRARSSKGRGARAAASTRRTASRPVRKPAARRRRTR